MSTSNSTKKKIPPKLSLGKEGLDSLLQREDLGFATRKLKKDNKKGHLQICSCGPCKKGRSRAFTIKAIKNQATQNDKRTLQKRKAKKSKGQRLEFELFDGSSKEFDDSCDEDEEDGGDRDRLKNVESSKEWAIFVEGMQDSPKKVK